MNKKTLQHNTQSRMACGTALPRTLVTGATSGIGYELATQLAQAGVPVIALGRNAQQLQTMRERFPHIQAVACDLHDISALPRLAAQWVAAFPDLACVIHNAGMQDNVRMDDAGYGVDHVRTEVNVNLLAPIVLTQALLPHLQSRRSATIVYITSGLGFAPKRTSAVYSATKAGLHLFSDALRLQMQGSAVQVIEAVMPLVDTRMTEGRGTGKISAAYAARAVIAGMTHRKPVIWVGKARGLPLLQRLAPGLLSHLMQRA